MRSKLLMDKPRLKRRFCLLQISYWCSTASFNSFAVAYMTAHGRSASAIGVLLALFTLLSLGGAFLFGQLCDRLHTHRKVFIGCCLAMLGAVLGIYFFVDTPLLFVFYPLLGLLLSPVASNMDTWIIKCFYETPQEYGVMRGWGSFGYATFILFYGGLITRFGYWIIVPFHTLFSLANILIALLLPDAPELPDVRPLTAAGEKGGFRALLANRRFLLLLGGLFLLGLVHNPIYQYTALIFDSIGSTVTHQGLALSVNAFAQVPLMMLAPRLRHVSSYKLMLAVVASYTVCNLIIGFSSSAVVVILGYTVIGLFYGLLLPTLRRTILDSSIPQLRTTAQSMGDACFGSLAGMTSSLVGGYILEAYNVPTLLGIAATLTLLVAPIFLLLLRMEKKSPRDA